MFGIHFLPANKSVVLGAVWESVEPPVGKSLKQISVGCHAVWALDNQGSLCVRREVTSVFPEGTHWQLLPTSTFDGAHQGNLIQI